MYNDALIQRDRAQQALSDLRKQARHAYQITLEASEHPQNFIEPQLAIVKQSDSLHDKVQVDQIDLERQQILGQLQAEGRESWPRT